MCQYGRQDKQNKGHCANSAQPSLEAMMQTAQLLNVDTNDLVSFEAPPEIPSPEETEENIQ